MNSSVLSNRITTAADYLIGAICSQICRRQQAANSNCREIVTFDLKLQSVPNFRVLDK